MDYDADFLPAHFWDALYTNHETAWDIGSVSTPLKTYIDQLKNKNIRILIPGAGKSYEAVYLAAHGFTDVTVVDISAVLTKSLHEKIARTHPSIKIITGDFFELKDSFDLILEQTFFCTFHPSLRGHYIKKVTELLTGNGKLAGVLFNRDFESGPPFGGNTDDYRQLFSTGLRIKVLEDCYNSIPPRAGSEVFLIACND
jgi:cyclopropane fatty-acyl-phospholipid synthase-like methyltransferase